MCKPKNENIDLYGAWMVLQRLISGSSNTRPSKTGSEKPEFPGNAFLDFGFWLANLQSEHMCNEEDEDAKELNRIAAIDGVLDVPYSAGGACRDMVRDVRDGRWWREGEIL